MGLKTTYYLRSLGASQVEKSTVNTAEFGSTHKRDNTSNVTAMPISGITDIKMATGMVSPLSVLPSVDTISASVATVVASAHAVAAPVAYAPVSSAVTAPIASPSMSKPLEIPADAPKKIYNITRAPEATCDGCQ
jgi:hypothetical protein